MDHSVIIERLSIFLHRQYNCLKDIQQVTMDLDNAIERQDGYSAEIILDERQDAILKLDQARQDLLDYGENHLEAQPIIARLILSDPDNILIEDENETIIKSLRLKNIELLRSLKLQDKVLNKKIAKDQSVY